jgi:hypothetical protein
MMKYIDMIFPPNQVTMAQSSNKIRTFVPGILILDVLGPYSKVKLEHYLLLLR